jgi:hypothetical protein
MERSSRRPGWGVDSRVSGRRTVLTPRDGRLKAPEGSPVTPTNVAPVPDPAAALMAPVAEPDTTKVPYGDVAWDLVDQWGADSFPASDPPANW